MRRARILHQRKSAQAHASTSSCPPSCPPVPHDHCERGGLGPKNQNRDRKPLPHRPLLLIVLTSVFIYLASNTNSTNRVTKAASSFVASHAEHVIVVALETTKEIATDTLSQIKKLRKSNLKEKCEDDAAWGDSFWRTAVESPSLCPRNRASDTPGLDLEELVSSLNSRTICGSFCVFHRDVLASTLDGPIKGWSLTHVEGTTEQKGCWEQVPDMKAHVCSVWYKKWSRWMEAKNDSLEEQSADGVTTDAVRVPPQSSESDREGLGPEKSDIEKQATKRHDEQVGTNSQSRQQTPKSDRPEKTQDTGESSYSEREYPRNNAKTSDERQIKRERVPKSTDAGNADTDRVAPGSDTKRGDSTQSESSNTKLLSNQAGKAAVAKAKTTKKKKMSNTAGAASVALPSSRTEKGNSVVVESAEVKASAKKQTIERAKEVKKQETTKADKKDSVPVLRRPSNNRQKDTKTGGSGQGKTSNKALKNNIRKKELPVSPPVKCDELELPSAGNKPSKVCGPRILVIGAMKCGTNTVGDLLLKHPRVKVNRCTGEQPNCDTEHFQGGKDDFWEMHALSHRFNNEPDDWAANYAKLLPDTNGVDSITIDKSPSYFNTEIFPGIAERAKNLLPNAKVVVTLCNPAERVFSEYNHNMRTMPEYLENFFRDKKVPMPSDFSSFVKHFEHDPVLCEKNPDFCYKVRRNFLNTGEYDVHLKEWKKAFGDESVLVLNMEDNSRDNVKKLLRHAGDVLPENEYPWDSLTENSQSFVNTKYAGRHSAYKEHSKAMKWLNEYFEPHNEQLSYDIGEDWPLSWADDGESSEKTTVGKPFAVWISGRVGSTWLSKALNAHPNILSGQEEWNGIVGVGVGTEDYVYNPGEPSRILRDVYNGKDKKMKRYLDRKKRDQPKSNVLAIGFKQKFFYCNMKKFEFRPVGDTTDMTDSCLWGPFGEEARLWKELDTNIVCMLRENAFDRAISKQLQLNLREECGEDNILNEQTAACGNKLRKAGITIDPVQLADLMKKFERRHWFELSLCKARQESGEPTFIVTYEDLYADPDGKFKALQSFLLPEGASILPYEKLDASVQKASESVSKMIKNWDEVKAHLMHTPLEVHLSKSTTLHDDEKRAFAVASS